MAKDKAIKLVLLSAGVVVLWFVSVEKLCFIEDCGDCMNMWDVVQYRVFSIVIDESKSEHGPNLLKTIAEDLGVPCPHKNLNQSNKIQYWGLCFRTRPGQHGAITAGGDISWYDAEMAAKVKEMAAADANFAEEFRQRVIFEHDWAYWKEFVQNLRGDEKAIIED